MTFQANKDDLILVGGAGGFIGGHLVDDLLQQGFQHVRAVDIKPLDQWYQCHPGADNRQLDLSEIGACREAAKDAAQIYNLAADMGGMGFIENNKALCMLTVLINTHLLMAAREAGVGRFFYSSSACVYAADKQTDKDVTALVEADAYPAMPEDGYGWEKLFSERMCRHFEEDFAIPCRVARYHNVYGPHGTWDGGREKAPAAICRKVAMSKDGDTIDVWGDGTALRVYTYVADLCNGIYTLMQSNTEEPTNIGSRELTSVNELVTTVAEVAGKDIRIRYVDGPVGVQARYHRVDRMEALGWTASTRLLEGIEQTYPWIDEQVNGKRSRDDA